MRSSTSLALSLRTLTLATAGVLLVLASPTWAIGPFCRSPSVPIPDTEPGISDDLVVSATNTISDLDVSVDISHTFVGDLVVTLTHVDTGTSVIIIDRPGSDRGTTGCSSDNIVATLDDEAASPVEDQCAPTPPAIAGTFSPNNPLSAFDGESIAGTWTLTISDRASGDQGTLNAWCLLPLTTVCTAGTPGRPNCHGQCISALAQDHRGIVRAASDLGFSSVADLQAAVTAFCGN